MCYYQLLNLGQNTPDTGCCCVCDHRNHRPSHISQPGHKFNISWEMYSLCQEDSEKSNNHQVKSSNCTSGDCITRERNKKISFYFPCENKLYSFLSMEVCMTTDVPKKTPRRFRFCDCPSFCKTL